jgi:hypothetical protein
MHSGKDSLFPTRKTKKRRFFANKRRRFADFCAFSQHQV